MRRRGRGTNLCSVVPRGDPSMRSAIPLRAVGGLGLAAVIVLGSSVLTTAQSQSPSASSPPGLARRVAGRFAAGSTDPWRSHRVDRRGEEQGLCHGLVLHRRRPSSRWHARNGWPDSREGRGPSGGSVDQLRCEGLEPGELGRPCVLLRLGHRRDALRLCRSRPRWRRLDVGGRLGLGAPHRARCRVP